jgi:cyclopropane fatty-acyl-phospholipid synthase-like methyltransferase
MEYFDSRENVENYIKMVDGDDGRDLINILKKHLSLGSTVLELGMGPGKDLEILAETFSVTGSDTSQVFLDLYKENHPDSDLLKIDALSVNTKRKFDCIYSNKVLHHLFKKDILQSFTSQRKCLNNGGLLMHSFWYGQKEEEHHGMWFAYYTEDELLNILGPGYQVIAMELYTELEENDSFYILLKMLD